MVELRQFKVCSHLVRLRSFYKKKKKKMHSRGNGDIMPRTRMHLSVVRRGTVIEFPFLQKGTVMTTLGHGE